MLVVDIQLHLRLQLALQLQFGDGNYVFNETVQVSSDSSETARVKYGIQVLELLMLVC